MNKISIKTEGESFNCFNLLQFLKRFLSSTYTCMLQIYLEKLFSSICLIGETALIFIRVFIYFSKRFKMVEFSLGLLNSYRTVHNLGQCGQWWTMKAIFHEPQCIKWSQLNSHSGFASNIIEFIDYDSKIVAAKVMHLKYPCLSVQTA